MSHPRLRLALVTALALAFAPPALAAGGPAMNVVLGGFSPVPANDAEVRAAVAAAVNELRGPTWLGRADLAAGSVRETERQVVAGTNYRFTFELKSGELRRPAKAQVWRDLKGARHLTWVQLDELGPADVDSSTPPSHPGLPGGWSDQDPAGSVIATRAKRALALLSGESWLGHALGNPRVMAARMQVVAGFNTWMAIHATVGGKAREVELVMYESPQDEASLSWVRLAGL